MLARPKSSLVNYPTEILSGITVSFALVPEAIAFSLIAGFSPSVGISTSFFICMLTSVFGGKPAMISGASGAIAVVVAIVGKNYGVDHVFAVVILAGIFQIAVGLLGLAKFIVLLSRPVMLGFVNGLAIIIFVSQIEQFRNVDQFHQQHWLTGFPLFTMLAIVNSTVVIVFLMPKIWKAAPPGFIAVLVVSSIVLCFRIQTPNVGDLAHLDDNFPAFQVPNVLLLGNSLIPITLYALFVAWVGAIESLVTIDLLNQITSSNGNSNREMIAQGLGNSVAGFFSGMGGCVMLGQSLVNFSSGGRQRLSGIVTSFMLLFFMTSGGLLLTKIPTGVLVGLMVTVALQTFNWESLRTIHKKTASEKIIVILVMIVTVLTHNIAIAVMLGIVVSCIVFAWESSLKFEVIKLTLDQNNVTYRILGPLFFGSISRFQAQFNTDGDPKHIVLDFSQSWISDTSGAEVALSVMTSYREAGKEIYVSNLDAKSAKLLDQAGRH